MSGAAGWRSRSSRMMRCSKFIIHNSSIHNIHSTMIATKTNKPRNTKKLPARRQVKPAATCDLSSLLGNDADWERAFTAWEKQISRYERFRGTLGDGPAALAKC